VTRQPHRVAGLALTELLLIGLTVLGLLSCRRGNDQAERTARQASTGTVINLLVNPSFEQIDAKGSPIGWMDGAHPTVSADPRRAHSGQVAAHGSTANGATDYFSQIVKIQGGAEYWLGHYTRSDRPDQWTRLQVNFGNDHGDTLDVKIVVVPTTSEWKWNEMAVTAPPNATTATVYLQPHGNGDVWFDDVWFGSRPMSRRP
jgi:hypothetical protein